MPFLVTVCYLELVGGEVEGPAPDHDADQREDEEGPEPVREEVGTAHAPPGRRLAHSPRPGSPSPPGPSPPRPMSPSICCAFASTPARAERSASFTPARTRSASASGSSGSIASAEISIARTSPAPFAVTLTRPPPTDDCAVSCAASSCICCTCCCICAACCMSLSMSNEDMALAFPLTRVECLLEQLEDLLFARGLLVDHRSLARLAELEGELEPSSGDVVERVGEQARVLRVAREVEVELRARRKRERERVAAQIGRMCLTQQGRRGDPAALLDGRQDRARPGLLELGELERRGADRDGHRLRLGFGLRLGRRLFRTCLGV